MGGLGAGGGCDIPNEKEAQGETRRGGKTRHRHMNPTDNEDEKTKGKEREIKTLNSWSAGAGVLLLCHLGLALPAGSLRKMPNGKGLAAPEVQIRRWVPFFLLVVSLSCLVKQR